MLTGDAKETAVAIARQIRLLPAHSNHEAQQVERSQSVKAVFSYFRTKVLSGTYFESEAARCQMRPQVGFLNIDTCNMSFSGLF